MIAEISALLERHSILMENNSLKLRKSNKIKTIHSSLAIEGNNLSEEQVSDIINGKKVIR
jgi:Fic family protein